MVPQCSHPTNIPQTQNLLTFFSAKFCVNQKHDTYTWVNDLFTKIYHWWFIPRNEPYIRNVSESIEEAVTIYLREDKLPEFFTDAKEYACRSIYEQNDRP